MNANEHDAEHPRTRERRRETSSGDQRGGAGAEEMRLSNPSTRTGFLAALRTLLRRRGSGAPSSSLADPDTRRSLPRNPKLLLPAAALAATLILGVALATATAPTVTIEPASEIGVTSALAKGTVNPEEKETNCHFDYLTDAQFTANLGNSEPSFTGAAEAPCTANPLNGNTAQAVEAELTALTPATEYHLRLVAVNSESESSEEAAPTFETDAAVAPTLGEALSSSEVAYTSAKLGGSINPKGGNANPIEGILPISWQFQYAPAAEAEPRNWQNANSEGEDPIVGAAAESLIFSGVSAKAEGLTNSTEYAFRLVANYAGGLEEVSPTEGTFTTLAVTKPSVSVDPVTTFTDSTANFVGHVNPNAPEPEGSTSPAEQAAFETAWHFECVAPGPSCGNPSGAAIAAGNTAKTVEAEVTGLEPNKAYYVVLVASNLGGAEEAATGASPSFTTAAVAPTVATGTNSPDNNGGVIVRGYVNPGNSEVTSCRFEYSLDSSFSQSAPCQGTIGSGSTPQTVTVDLSGLDAGATYNFRIVAASAPGTETSEAGVFAVPAEETSESCPNEDRREEQHASLLPDCRAYEMVSPPDKNGNEVLPSTMAVQAAQLLLPGKTMAIKFTSLGYFGDAVGGGVATDYLSERDGAVGGTGWSTHAITPPQSPLSFTATLRGQAPSYEADLSPDLTRGVFRSFSLLSPAPNVEGVSNLYLRNDLRRPGAGNYELLTDAFAPVASSTGEAGSDARQNAQGKPNFDGASNDFQHILFESKARLTPEAPLGTNGFNQGQVYEWNNGTTRLASVLPDGTVPARAVAGQGSLTRHVTPHVISADGSRVFFTVPHGTCDGPLCGELYMRSDHTETVQLNASERTDCAEAGPCTGAPSPDPTGPLPATYWGASSDGQRIFFTSTEALTDDAPPQGGLYIYDASKPDGDLHNLTFLAGGVGGVIGVSDDGSYAYFVSNNQLVTGGPPVETGIFAWHEDGSVHGSLAFVGSIEIGTGSELLNSDVSLLPPRARVAPDGRDLVFSSTGGEGLTGYQHGSCPANGSNGEHCRELYFYSAPTEQLACVSCNPDGTPAAADSVLGGQLSPATGGVAPLPYLNHAISADGRYAFFSTSEALVSEDTNSTSDAYEYDVATAHVHLLSSGTDPNPSFFMEAGPDGRDAFILTRQRLVGWDNDASGDLYDLRAGGGFPEPPPRSETCRGDDCRTAPSQAPGSSNPATQTFNGQGNPSRQHKKRRHHKKRHKHHQKRAADNNQRAGR